MQSFSIADANTLVRGVLGCQQLSNEVRKNCGRAFDAKPRIGGVASPDKEALKSKFR
jgi:hypothetical protein